MNTRTFVQQFTLARGMVLLLLALLLGGAVSIFSQRTLPAGSGQDAQAACEQFVQEVLQASAPPAFEQPVSSEVQAGHYQINGHVVAQNDAGGPQRIAYRCTASRAADATYRVEKLAIQR